jgi:predicted Zn-ribbon and HTH transcriptional regulator
MLEQAGRRLDVCQDCGSLSYPLAVHHIDGNPYNNAIENLAVLCPQCHLSRHGPAEEEGVVPWYEGTIRDRQSIHEESEIEEEKWKSRGVKLVLKTAVFRCRECGGLTRVEQAGNVIRGPVACAHCKNMIGFDFLQRLSTFAPLEE